jgi:sec-independent protein translocase protein TatA
MPFKLGPMELVIILVIVFIIFGAGKLPQIFSDTGKAMRNFRESQKNDDDEEVVVVRRKKKTTKST